MRSLVVIGFNELSTADNVLNKLQLLQEKGLATVEDACVVERLNGGRVHIKQSADRLEAVPAEGEERNATWGSLAAIPFFKPLAGLMASAIHGVGVGPPSGSLADFGIRDDIINSLGSTIPKGTSALFVVFNSKIEDRVLAEIRAYNPRAYGRVQAA